MLVLFVMTGHTSASEESNGYEVRVLLTPAERQSYAVLQGQSSSGNGC